MSGFLQRFLDAWYGYDATLVDDKPDPRLVPVTLSQGELDDLHGQINGLDARVAGMQNVQHRSIRRLFLLAKNVAKVIKANNVTSGDPVGNDGVQFSLSNDNGKWLEMIVYPFSETFVLRDASGVMNDVVFHFGNNERGDLPRETILQLNGFAEFASRNAADDSDAYWAQTVNDALAPVTDDVAYTRAS